MGDAGSIPAGGALNFKLLFFLVSATLTTRGCTKTAGRRPHTCVCAFVCQRFTVAATAWRVRGAHDRRRCMCFVGYGGIGRAVYECDDDGMVGEEQDGMVGYGSG